MQICWPDKEARFSRVLEQDNLRKRYQVSFCVVDVWALDGGHYGICAKSWIEKTREQEHARMTRREVGGTRGPTTRG